MRWDENLQQNETFNAEKSDKLHEKCTVLGFPVCLKTMGSVPNKAIFNVHSQLVCKLNAE